MNGILIAIVICFFCYYLLYKFIMESGFHYLMWLIFNGIVIVATGFILHVSRRVFYTIETAGLIYLILVYLTVICHFDIIERIKDQFK